MSRVRATGLALVNWKGVFFERYLLDRHVTALEGANGAGKTTVMIAAYVVLLPDLTRLRFTNLGETGATGGDKGIWGRLGELGRPSYAVIDVDLSDGRRVLLGVHIERKAEPTLTLTPFIVANLDASVRLSDVLLLTREHEEEVPSLEQLRENLSARSAELSVFQTSKEYFASLFERGITPLRLSTDEERNKLNEMLKTSMTGGISRALTSELRSFLLREETGLSDTLTRMRGNLDSCRRTRTEVAEARRLEQEISAVLEAGQAMWLRASAATRFTAEELGQRLHAALTAHAEMELSLRAFDAALAEAAAREARLSSRRAELAETLAVELERGRKAQRARALRARADEQAATLSEATAASDRARSERDRVSALRSELKSSRERARAAYERAAQGLADSQAGLEELHRNAHAARRARESLLAARELLAMPELTLDSAADALRRSQAEVAELDAARARDDREFALLDLRRKDFEAGLAALTALTGEIQPGSEYERARVELLRLAQLEGPAGRLLELEQQRQAALSNVERQQETRRRAEQLGLPSSLDADTLRSRLHELEAELREHEETAQSERLHAERAGQAHERAEELVKRLRAAEPRFQRAEQLVARLRERHEAPLASRVDVSKLQSRLIEERQRLAREFDVQLTRREELSRTQSTLEAGSFVIDPELLRLRDEVDGELLMNRFEELELTEAARLEAELGPLAHAIYVDDAARAARRIAGQPRERASVVFVDERSELYTPSARGEQHGSDLIVTGGSAVHVSRIPEQPSFGRLARVRRIAELGQEVAELDQVLEKLQEQTRHCEGALRDAEALSALADVLENANPSELRVKAEDEARTERSNKQHHAQLATAAIERLHQGRQQLRDLTELLAQAHWLEQPDQAERAARLSHEFEQAQAAQAELARKSSLRAELQRWQDALRLPPPSVTELERVSAQRERSDRRRQQLFQAQELLEQLLTNRLSTTFEDAERALAEQTALVPTLRAQHEATREALAQTEQAAVDAEADWEQLAKEFSERDAERAALDAQARRLAEEIAELEQEAGRQTPEQAADAAANISLQLTALEREERAIASETAVRRERRDRRLDELAELERGKGALEQLYAPAQQAWTRLLELLQSSDLPEATAQPLPTSPSAALWPDAKSKLELLLGRLASARGSQELLQQIGEVTGDVEDFSGETYLRVWLLVRDWLKRRVPSQVADVEEPLVALERLRDQLAVLEQRLGRQEGDLRGTSEDVARGIEVQLRRAKAQVRRLNQSLEGVAFGSIHGIRVKIQRVERMEQILTALREGAAQELLFQSHLPIEDALNEIFKRFGGGKTGGQKLLDYREYLELSVEVQRRAEAEWEAANPTRVSTGEAIGVGATLMMVILTEWERDANLLRGKRAAGTLRFLFLDEANRLSQDNLGVLFELCKVLDLQLLIAAPEVARAEGNTTYRLVRRLSDDGREEVIVTGRRAHPFEEPSVAPEIAPPTELPDPTEQLTLLS